MHNETVVRSTLGIAVERQSPEVRAFYTLSNNEMPIKEKWDLIRGLCTPATISSSRLLRAAILAEPDQAHTLVASLCMEPCKEGHFYFFYSFVGVLSGINDLEICSAQLEHETGCLIARCITLSPKGGQAEYGRNTKSDVGILITDYIKMLGVFSARRNAVATIFGSISRWINEPNPLAGLPPEWSQEPAYMSDEGRARYEGLGSEFGEEIWKNLVHKVIERMPPGQLAPLLHQALSPIPAASVS